MRLTALAFLLLATPAFAQAPDAATPPPGEPVVTPVPTLTNPPMTGPRLLISTAMGDITLQLDSAHAPISVANVLKFVKARHYDGTVVYRVAKGFVIQMGSWEAHMKGRGYKPVPVPLEANNGLHNLRGTVALARAEAPDSAGPEFFISLADNTDQLDHAPGDAGNSTGYAVFGQVTSGMEVVDAIGNVAVGDDGPMPGQAPVEPILIKKISLLK
ncbi:MAG: peptidylprolyl isomerase [Alphaproteobacteria bacterium]|jgi:cyclophilin family peptidyl-prolyl cis-trans isomerase|nr:peptidylprolyl isomerase [Alphaproteobacteria bacterium]MDB5741541.1 peptidylprolyl isomerase [Alphaproteobacteria bacterium]